MSHRANATITESAALLPAPPNRRGALAWVALQDAPTPNTVDIVADDSGYASIGLNVDSIAEVDAWGSLLGAKRGEPFIATSGIAIHTVRAEISGWRISVSAHVKPSAQPQPLDSAVREQLTALVGAQ